MANFDSLYVMKYVSFSACLKLRMNSFLYHWSGHKGVALGAGAPQLKMEVRIKEHFT